MTLRSDQKALLFLGAVAVLGAGVRVVRAASGRSADAAQPALERQSQAADSAARAGRGRASGASRAKARTSKQSTKRASEPASEGRPDATTSAGAGLLDRPGYVGGRLDLDVATAAQIDLLPGVGPAMAKRIVRDRLARGPFTSPDGLRRVSGVGPAFLARIGPHVIFSGTMRHPDPADTVIPKGRR
jgi:competence protein ComEA